MPVFPLHVRPKESYKEPPRSFGSSRDHGARKHAGCDLYAPAGTEVLAVEDGTVIRGPYLFYDVVYALEVQHPSGIVRYGEISRAAEGIAAEVTPRSPAGEALADTPTDRRYSARVTSISQCEDPTQRSSTRPAPATT